MKCKIIGGEFTVDLQNHHEAKEKNVTHDGIYKYSTGRSALYYILLDLKNTRGIHKILLPDYLCSSVVIAAEKAKVDVVFYPLNEILELDESFFAKLYDETYAVLLINYYGLKDISNQVDYIRSLNAEAVIIEDDVQAFYEFEKELNGVDYKFTSLRKTFACPDGGLVKTNNTMPIINDENKFHQFKLAGSLLKTFQKPEFYDDDVFLSMFEKGEDLIDEDIAKGMSKVSGNIISKTDTVQIAEIRRRNAKFICDGLQSLGIHTIIPVPEEKVPLFVPVFLEDRNKVRKFLFEHNCFCPVHWPLESLNIAKGVEMAEHELSIIVDQRYTAADMEYILNLIAKSKLW